MSERLPGVLVTLPPWVGELVERGRRYGTDDDKVRLALALARENVLRETGGPFGAAVFEKETGALVAVGVNRVLPLSSSILHAEIVALLAAQSLRGSYTLRVPGLPAHELVTSCEPCAMCLGAALSSGVVRVVAGALREDAGRIGFEEGPVFPESWRYLEDRGIEVVRGVLRHEASRVLDLYRERGGEIYNG